MDKIILVVAIAILYSSPAMATKEERASAEFQYSLVSAHSGGFDDVKPTVWQGEYGSIANANQTGGKKSQQDWSGRGVSMLGSSVGLGVAPMFGTYGVVRTSSGNNSSTYVAFGFTLDDLDLDDTAAWDDIDENGLSYGFGVNHSTFNVEYMLYMDKENSEVSGISLGLISEF